MQICKRCIMDDTVPDIKYDSNGECNFCKFYDQLNIEYPLYWKNKSKLTNLVRDIKNSGKNNRYDIIHGVSGGTDSIYSLYVLKKLGIRPLAVHIDNGWNSEIAVRNIQQATEILDIDLYTWVLDWREFKELQLSFLKASVPDLEIPSDWMIPGALVRIAANEKVKYYSHGHSFRTEGTAPKKWTYMDGRYIESIYHKYTGKSLVHYPNLQIWDLFYYNLILKIREFRILAFVEYDKTKARRVIEEKLGWEYYGGHHFESHYSKFVHSFMFPQKFNIDYRKVALSADVLSGNITRDTALEILSVPIDKNVDLDKDIEYVIKKLGITKTDFEEILRVSPKTFLDYPNYFHLINRLKLVIKLGTRLGILPKTVEKFVE